MHSKMIIVDDGALSSHKLLRVDLTYSHHKGGMLMGVLTNLSFRTNFMVYKT